MDGPRGLVGITLKPSTMKRLALSLYTFSTLSKYVADMRDLQERHAVIFHKEESKGRIESDACYRANIRQKYQSCVDPLEIT